MSNAFKKSIEKISKLASDARSGQLAPQQPVYSTVALPKAQLNLLETLPDGITLHGESGKAIWASHKACEAFDIRLFDISGFGFLEGVNPQDRLTLLQLIADCRNQKPVEPIQIRKLKPGKNGKMETMVLECRASVYAPEQAIETATLALLTTRDVTEQATLTKTVNSRVDVAENANRLKTTFISNVSHELRTPLNAIIGFSEMLEGKTGLTFSEDAKMEYAGLINQSATHLLTMLNDILDVSKIEAGKFQFLPELFDIADAMNNNLRLVQPIAQKSKVSLRTDFSDELPHIFADKRAIRQITLNLVANAIKFSKPGSSVAVSLNRTARAIRISVSDEGIGMDAKTLEKLGSIFFQAQQSDDHEYEGTGLGLSIVKGLVELHKGTVRFESGLGKGTTVLVELPLNACKGVPVPADPDSSLVFLNNVKTKTKIERAADELGIQKTG